MNFNPRTPLRTAAGPNSAAPVYAAWRERFVRPMLIGASGFGFFALIAALFGAGQGIVQNTIFILAYLLLLAVTFIGFPYWARIGVFLFIVWGLALNELLTTGIMGDSVAFFLAFVLFATLMLSGRAGVTSLGIMIATIIVTGVLMASHTIGLVSSNVIPATVGDWVSTTLTTSLFAVALTIGLQQLQREFLVAQQRTAGALDEMQKERITLESRIEARTSQLSAVNEVGRVASSILDPQELAGRVANLITEHFGYYYAALFLVDEAQQDAWLYSATGEAGRVLKETKHHLKIGGNSMVGTAISTGKPRVALDVGEESVRFQNPLLPYTRSEIALPLIVGERVLGALDVQSTKAGAFGPQEIETLQGMATQFAIALENARLFQEAQRSLDEAEAVQRQYVIDAWKPLAESSRLEYKIGDDDVRSGKQIEIPLSLREQVIGKISLASDSELTAEQRNLIETVAAQATLALENARLVEQSQSAARYEHQLADITGKIWTATTSEGILQTALRELGEALDANDASIELKMDGSHE